MKNVVVITAATKKQTFTDAEICKYRGPLRALVREPVGIAYVFVLRARLCQDAPAILSSIS